MYQISQTHSDNTLRFRSFFLWCGLLMLLSELWKQYCLTFLLNGGVYNWRYFPFQLCSMPMYLLLFLPHIKRAGVRSVLLTFLMTFGLLGGIAVFADTSGLHYPLPILTLHSYAWHILLILLGILAAAVRFSDASLKRSQKDAANALPLRDFRNASFLYLAFCAAAAVVNRLAGMYGKINMFYINVRYPMEQIFFSDLVPYIGNFPVILLYIFMTIVGAGILFLIWSFIYLRHSHSNGYYTPT